MKALRTQFDASGFSGAVATPTCSSCCCCCCCVATVTSAGMVSKAVINKSGSDLDLPRHTRSGLTLLAVAAPIIAITVLYFTLIWIESASVVVTDNTVLYLVIFVTVLATIYGLVLNRLKARKVALRAAILAIITIIFMAIEMYGAILLLTQSSSILSYIILVVVAVILVRLALLNKATVNKLTRLITGRLLNGNKGTKASHRLP